MAGRMGVLAYYQLNKAYIARVLCVNKERPQLRCQGKCFLARQLKAQAEREQKVPFPAKYSQEIVFYCPTTAFLFDGLSPVKVAPAFTSFYLETPYTSPLSGIDHPPKV
jgi:hypothetical protein